MDEFQLSIIIPVFNSEFYIRDCLNSIFTYSTQGMEIILVNDGSLDNSLEICKEYKSLYKNIKLINLKKNMGVGYARNIGLEKSKGKYIAFIDSDDYIKNDMLNKLLAIIEKNNIDIIMCQTEIIFLSKTKDNLLDIDNKFLNRILSKEEIKYLLKQEISKYGYLHGKIYKRNLFIDNNMHFDINCGEDILFNLTIIEMINSFYILDKPLYVYRENIDSICNQVINSKLISEYKISLDKINQCINNIEILSDITFKFIDSFMIKFLLDYQNPIFQTMVYNEQFSKNQRFILFGSSDLGKRYMSMLERYNYNNIIFVDNDIKKHNTYIRNHKIISLNELKNIKNNSDIIIIASQYFVYIAKQLLDNKIINSISDVLLSKDNTKLKQSLIEFFEFAMTIDIYLECIKPH